MTMQFLQLSMSHSGTEKMIFLHNKLFYTKILFINTD